LGQGRAGSKLEAGDIRTPPAAMLEVRRIRLADAASFRECLNHVASESGNLAVDDGRVVGWCDIRREEAEAMAHVGLLGMGVHVDYRGHGLGRKLLERCLEHAPRLGLERVGLEVFAGNRPAVALYESMGFRHEGVRRHALKRAGRVEDLVVMAWFAPGVELTDEA
jgi:ribosomal protein S18 acetylase RimI-like enzyme